MILTLNTDHLQRFNITVEDLVLLNVIHTYASTSTDGICRAEKKDMGDILGLAPRRVATLLQEIYDAGLIEQVVDGLRLTGPWRDAILGKSTPPPPTKEKAKTKPSTRTVNDPEEGYQYWADTWMKGFGGKIKLTDKMRRQIRSRRNTFTAEEILTAMKNRYRSTWLRTDGKQYWADWNSFWRSDDKIHNYINLSPEQMTNANETKRHQISGVLK